MKITVKRFELDGLKSIMRSADADPAYEGSATFGGTNADGVEDTVTVQVVDETPKESEAVVV